MPRILALALLVALGITGSAASAHAGSIMPLGRPAIPPAGFLGFCIKYLQECRLSQGQPVVVELTAEKRRELDDVQAEINRSITPREDPTHAWDYARDGYGDCNKFALGKRRALIERGWPRQALSLATATTERGEGHLVLVVHTSKGDLVLDNRLAPVVDWTYLPYHWISMQSAESPVRWMSVLSQPINTADASHAVAPAVSTH